MSPLPTPQPRVRLPRGGIAAGEGGFYSTASTAPTYAPTPPKSTYTGPKVAGSYGGFVGVLVGSGIAILLLLLGAGLYRYRLLQKRKRQQQQDQTQSQSRGGGVRTWAEENEEAFELPSSLNLSAGPFGGGFEHEHVHGEDGTRGKGGYAVPYSPSLNESALHLAPEHGLAGAGAGGSPRLYQHEGVSQEGLIGEGGGSDSGGRTYDGIREGSGRGDEGGQARRD
ncbi:hypothetical protein JCM11641_004047 [Rhodosporidiobolus odoratus]